MSHGLLRCITILKMFYLSDVLEEECCNAAVVLNHVPNRCVIRGRKTHSRVGAGQMPSNARVRVCVCERDGK